MDEASIFAAALEKELPDERNRFLDEACGDNAGLRAEVEELLLAHEGAGSFLEQPLAGLAAIIATGEFDTVDEAAGEVSLDFLTPTDKPNCLGTLGQYEVVKAVGRGGMGLVLRAYDTKLNRVVAIKVMAPELAANPTAVKRFLREARAAAAVSHDHVVTIHAIEEENRPPYIVMEYVDGQSLQEKIRRTGCLELKAILRIGMQMARGLSAAHEQGLVHRDIKPANILLENGVERVKLTDFGLARAVDDVSVTQTGQIAGTPQFMSPEQAQGYAIDARSDLFSLGSVLYTMCTARPPFRAETAVAMLRRVTDDDPRSICEVNSDTPNWLEAIIFKLLAKDPAERFQSAENVAELLSQHLAHVQHPTTAPKPKDIPPPIRAGGSLTCSPATKDPGYKPAPTRRWPFIVTGVAAMLLMLAALGTIIYVATDRGTLVIESDDENVEITISQPTSDRHDGMEVRMVDRVTGSSVVRLPSGHYRLMLMKGANVNADIEVNQFQLTKDQFVLKRGDEVIVKLRRRPPTVKAKADEAGEWSETVAIRTRDGFYWRAPAGGGSRIVADVKEIGSTSAFTLEWQDDSRAWIKTRHGFYVRGIPGPDGKLESTKERGSSVEFRFVWVDREQQIFHLRTREDTFVCAPLGGGSHLDTIVRPNSSGIFTLVPMPRQSSAEQSVAHELTEVRSLNGHTDFVNDIAYSPNGKFVVSAGEDGTVRVWDVETGVEIRKMAGIRFVKSLAVSPDGKLIAVGIPGEDSIHLLDFDTGQIVNSFGPRGSVHWSLAFSRDGTQLLAGDHSGSTFLLNVTTGEEIQELTKKLPAIETVAFSGDGTIAMAADYNDTIRLWDARDWRLLREIHDKSRGAALSNDGRLLFSGGNLFDTGNGRRLRRLNVPDDISDLHFTPDDRHIVVCQWSNLLRILDVQTGEEVARAESSKGAINEVAISPDGRSVVTAGGWYWKDKQIRSGDNTLRLWRLPDSAWPERFSPTER